MKMSHLLADTDEELHAFASKLGISRNYHQCKKSNHSHYDICQSKRGQAIHLGALILSRRELALLLRSRA